MLAECGNSRFFETLQTSMPMQHPGWKISCLGGAGVVQRPARRQKGPCRALGADLDSEAFSDRLSVARVRIAEDARPAERGAVLRDRVRDGVEGALVLGRQLQQDAQVALAEDVVHAPLSRPGARHA